MSGLSAADWVVYAAHHRSIVRVTPETGSKGTPDGALSAAVTAFWGDL